MTFHEFLQTVPELADLTHEEAETLEQAMVVKDYPDEFEFFEENMPGEAVYLIVKGEVAVSHEKSSERGLLQITRLHAGEWFGLISLITERNHEASCKAVGPVQAASLPRAAFRLLYESNAPIALHFQHLVARQLTRDYRVIADLLRQVIFADNKDEAQDIFDKVVSQYRGPERRGAERRDQSVPTSH